MTYLSLLQQTALASALALTGLALTGTGALALGDPALTNADDLVIKAGATHELAPGNHVFDDLVIADAATLVIPAGVSITVNRLHADDGTILYRSGQTQGPAVPTAQVIVFDGAGLQSLTVIGHGADGAGHRPGAAAATGAPGRSACSRYNPLDWCDQSASPGGPGQAGAAGGKGEDALQATFYIVGLQPGAVLTYNAVGGDGGRGQDGGAGGAGGNNSTLHTGKAGGMGGDGGAGGASGGSGKVVVYLVADDAGAEVKPDWIRLTANVAPGLPGAGGAPGAGGRNGNGCPDVAIGQCRQPTSTPGAQGARGAMGPGPVADDAGRAQGDFVQVQLMTRETFGQFALAQRVLGN